MRNDSSLFTGSTSAQTTKVTKAREAREERDRVKANKRTTLTKSADIVLDEIDKEINRTIMEQLDLGEDTNFESLRLYKKSMTSLKSRISNIMREKK